MGNSSALEVSFARVVLSNLRLKYYIEELVSSPNRNQNFLNLLGLISDAERKLESLLQTTAPTHVPTSEEISVEVVEVIETMKVEDEMDIEELVEEDSVDSEFTDLSRNSSTPLEEEDIDSLDLELIPQFFFAETEDADSLTGLSLLFEEVENPEIMEFSKLNPVRPDKMNDGKTESSKDLITHLKLNCKIYLYLHLEFTRSIFDRGKLFARSVLIDDTKRKFVYELGLRDGYRFNWSFMDSIANVLVKNGDTAGGGKLFVKMLQWDIMCFKNKGVGSHQMASEKFLCPCFNFTGGVFDRRRDIELMGRSLCFDGACEFYVVQLPIVILFLKMSIS